MTDTAGARRAVRRRRVWSVLAVVAVLAIAATGVYAASLLARVTGNIDAIERPGGGSEQVPSWDGPVNLLIIGSDTRDGLTSGSYNADDVAGSRSDTLMLLHVNAAHTNATLVSIPRDTMAPRPQCTGTDGSVRDAQDVAQINAAFDVSAFCTLDTVRALTGIGVNHFVVVNFDGFIKITDAVGGVDVCLAQPVDDPDSGLHLDAGQHTVKGAEALSFVRVRHGVGDGSDLDRIRTQQTYLAALARKVKSAGTLTNPVTLFNLADAVSGSLTVDKGLSSADGLVGLAGTLARVDLNRMNLVQMPAEDYPPDPNRVQPSAAAAELWAALREDRPVVIAPAGTTSPTTPAPGDGTAADEAATVSPGSSDSTGGSADEDQQPTPTPSVAPTTAVTLAPDTRGQTAEQRTCAGG